MKSLTWWSAEQVAVVVEEDEEEGMEEVCRAGLEGVGEAEGTILAAVRAHGLVV